MQGLTTTEPYHATRRTTRSAAAPLRQTIILAVVFAAAVATVAQGASASAYASAAAAKVGAEAETACVLSLDCPGSCSVKYDGLLESFGSGSGTAGSSLATAVSAQVVELAEGCADSDYDSAALKGKILFVRRGKARGVWCGERGEGTNQSEGPRGGRGEREGGVPEGG